MIGPATTANSGTSDMLVMLSAANAVQNNKRHTRQCDRVSPNETTPPISSGKYAIPQTLSPKPGVKYVDDTGLTKSPANRASSRSSQNRLVAKSSTGRLEKT